jgi:hypothetical protein
MSETRKIAAILVADVVGYSRLAAAALVRLGRQAEARSAVEVGLAINPTFPIAGYRADWTASNDEPTYLAGLQAVFEGLRKAGMPEQ